MKIPKKVKKDLKKKISVTKTSLELPKRKVTWNFDVGDLVKISSTGMIAIVLEKNEKDNATQVLVSADDTCFWISPSKVRKV
tara:strand:- start:5849 stop:6094 length:246 start_codon:yes stop_codon:yes gene_type:complete